MRRKPAIFLLIVIFLLLLAGGGGVAVHFHLRSKAPPTAAELEAFLDQIPTSTRWKLSYTKEEMDTIPGRFSSFGIHFFDRPRRLKSYWYFDGDAATGTPAAILLSFEKQRINHTVIAAPPAAAEEFRHLMLERFPRLQPVLFVNP